MAKGMPPLHHLPFFLLTMAALSLPLTHSQGSLPDSAIKAGYWPSFTAPYVPISSINTSLFTHLLYAFAGIDPQTFQVVPDDAVLISQFSPTLHSLNPSIITLLSIGGGNANSTLFSLAMSTSTSRKSFIDSSIALARANGFDGLDIDWEFPQSEKEMADFGEFLVEWRDAVEKEVVASSNTSMPLLLTAAVYYASRKLSTNTSQGMISYPLASINKNLDSVHIMAFDYHGYWENFTGEHTALDGRDTNFTTLFGLRQWISDGLNPHMAIVGLAAYGRSWTLLNASQNGVGAPTIGAGPIQPTSKWSGIFYYFEIEDFITSQNASIVYDNVTASAYCYTNQVWIGYDDPTTLATKIKTFKDLGFNGYFFWALSYDVNKTWPLSTKASFTMDSLTTSSNKTSNYSSSPSTHSYFSTYLWLGCFLFLHIASHRL